MSHGIFGHIFILTVALLGVLGWPLLAQAHPLTQGSLDVVIAADRINVTARVTLEEVSVTNMLATRDPLRPPASGASDEAFAEHAEYLAKHLHFAADGRALVGRVVRVVQGDSAAAAGAQ